MNQYTCPVCQLSYQAADTGPSRHIDGVVHANVCTRFQCLSCGDHFAILPEPLKKRFGRYPTCMRCTPRALQAQAAYQQPIPPPAPASAAVASAPPPLPPPVFPGGPDEEDEVPF